MDKLTRFIIYGLLGLLVEVLYTGFFSLVRGDISMQGFTYLVMVPIYGLAILLEPVHERIIVYRWWIRGLIYLGLIWGIEYLGGGILELIIGYCPWTYTDPLNVNGYITLRMAPEWFFAGLLFERVRLFLDQMGLRALN